MKLMKSAGFINNSWTKRLLPFILILLFLILPPSYAFPDLTANLTVVVENYDDAVKLTLISSNFSGNFTYSATFVNSTTLTLPQGSYFAYLEARNLTFTKRVEILNSTTLRFNLAFSSDPGILSISYHTLIYPSTTGFEVSDLVIISNNANVNFRGNLSIPLPKHRNLEVTSSTLSFLDYSIVDNQIVFKNLLVAEKSSGQIMIEYTLPSNTFKRHVEGESGVMILTPAEVERISPNLIDIGVRSFSGSNFRVIAGNVSGSYLVELKINQGVDLNPLALAGIVLISGSVFLYFFERRGGWKF